MKEAAIYPDNSADPTVVGMLKQKIAGARRIAAIASRQPRAILESAAEEAERVLRRGAKRVRDLERKALTRAAEGSGRAARAVRRHPWVTVGVVAAVLATAFGMVAASGNKR